MTVHELAEMSEVSEDAITKIENGRRRPRPSTIRKLAGALDVDPQELRAQPQAVAHPFGEES